MATYAKIAFAFDRFLRSLDLNGLSSWEIKLINLIRANFDKIADAGTAGGKRAKIINELIHKQGKTVSGEFNISKGEAVDTYFPILKLSSLEVENFRGFSEKRCFNFEKQYTFIYGPNGSGKSSFCEALEYSMLGYVSEAEAKRMNLSKYVTNMVTGKSSDPVLAGRDVSNKVVKIYVSPDDYHFCFIEKNRIDGFARITSKTPGDQGELLASLFGLDDFNNFIANFTNNIDNYIDTEGKKANELKTKKVEIEKEIQIEREFKEKLSELDQEKKKLIEETKLAESYEELIIVIHGDENTTGKIASADNKLQAPLKQKYEFRKSQDTFNKLLEISTEIANYQKLKEHYDKEKDGINFRKVYQLVIDLEEVSKDKCPVCETPITLTNVNPYENAKRKLKELEALAQLEVKKEQTWNLINEKFQSILLDIQSRMSLAEEFHIDYKISIPQTLLGKSLSESYEVLSNLIKLCTKINQNMELAIQIDEEVEKANLLIEQMTSQRNILIEERKKLIEFSNRIKEIKSKENTYKETIQKAQAAVAKFNETNKELINAVEHEKEQLTINREFVKGYANLLRMLIEYKNSLPIKLLENLNDLTKEFYNAINRNDEPFELIEKIELPSTPGQKIKIYFKNEPKREMDALHVLSEGHIRCLGLAILLSKNVNDRTNLIIFDDVVNAIDDDHRGGIREVLFNNEKLKNKQIILTSHAEEFIKDVDNLFSTSDYSKLVNRITFLTPENRVIRYKESTSNYLLKAKEHCSSGEKRETLQNCRCALENLTDNLWKTLNRKYNTNVTVQMRTPTSSPDLMSKVNGLHSFLTKTVKEEEFNTVIEIFAYLAGLNTTYNTIWTYLNKGTHDETDKVEFDPAIVKEVLEKLLLLDEQIKKIRV